MIKTDFANQAVDALRAALQEISGIKLKRIQVDRRGGQHNKNIVANIEIYGHSRVLICKVGESNQTSLIKRALSDLNRRAKVRAGEMMPVLITPSLSPEAQSLCKASNAGFLDLEGNVRLVMKEVFIAKRSLPHRHALPPQAEPLPTSETAHWAHVA
jgi:hypothetical protein